MRKIVLKRVSCSQMYGTFGILKEEEIPFATTLEPVLPIPPGVYRCELYDSPHFKKQVFLLKDVPEHEFIEIHVGNFLGETEGCILIGESYTSSWGIGMSGAAFFNFMNRVMKGVAAFDLEIANA